MLSSYEIKILFIFYSCIFLFTEGLTLHLCLGRRWLENQLECFTKVNATLKHPNDSVGFIVTAIFFVRKSIFLFVYKYTNTLKKIKNNRVIT